MGGVGGGVEGVGGGVGGRGNRTQLNAISVMIITVLIQSCHSSFTNSLWRRSIFGSQ